MKGRRYLIPAAVGAVGLALLVAGCRLASGPAPPRHLILVLFDTLRADRMSAYGYESVTTPFLDSLEGEIRRYRDVKSPAPWTVPSHSSMFTGLLPSEHRAQWGRMKLEERHTTLAETLRESGFCTYGISANLLVSNSTGLDQGFDSFELVRGPWKEKSATILSKIPEVLDRASEQGCRLFLFVNFMDTHIPYSAQRYGAQWGAQGVGPIKNARTKWEINAGIRPFEGEERRQHGVAYDAAVRYTDDLSRDLFRLLEDREFLDESLVVLTSDHGDGLGEHAEIGHSISVWEEQLAIPLLARLPKGRGAGVFEPRTSLVALTPSVLDWLHVDRPEHLKGAATLEESAEGPVIAEYRSYFSESNRKTNTKMAELYPELAARVTHSHVLYCGRHKLIANDGMPFGFFDLAADPMEQTNLAAQESPDWKRCRQNYSSLLRLGSYTPFEGADEGLEKRPETEVDLEDLRALGYVQ